MQNLIDTSFIIYLVQVEQKILNLKTGVGIDLYNKK